MAGKEISFSDNEFIVSKTDTKGKITYGNELFIKMSGYKEGEILHQPHNILRHADMPKVIFKYLWSQIEAKREVFAYVVNQTKSKDYYWVFAHITPSIDENGKIIGFHSARRKPKNRALEIIKPLYRELLIFGLYHKEIKALKRYPYTIFLKDPNDTVSSRNE